MVALRVNIKVMIMAIEPPLGTTSDSTRIRPPAVASLFYPGSSDELRRTVRQLLRESLTEGDEPIPAENLEAGTTLRALIVPHAG